MVKALSTGHRPEKHILYEVHFTVRRVLAFGISGQLCVSFSMDIIHAIPFKVLSSVLFYVLPSFSSLKHLYPSKCFNLVNFKQDLPMQICHTL